MSGAADSTGAGFVVIGAGAIGLAVAHALAGRGRTVVVLERFRPGAGASGVAGGMLAPISEVELEEPELLELGRESLGRYPEFVADLERETGERCGYRTEGTIWVATTRDDREELERLRDIMAERGFRARPLDAAELREREPHLSGRVLAGMLVEEDHQVDPRRLVRALERGLLRRRGRVVYGARAQEIHVAEGRVRAVSGTAADGTAFTLACEGAIVAAGAWSERDLALPLGPLTLRPVKGQLLRLRGAALLRHVVRAPDVYLVPREDGELLVGATMEEMGFDATPTAGAALDLLRHAWEVLPGIYDLELTETCAGLRSATEDHLPLIGATVVRGLHLAVGHYRNGILLAPATAHHLARLILDGEEAAVLRPFRPSRLTAAAASREEPAP